MIGIDNPLGRTTTPEPGLGHLAGFTFVGLLTVGTGTTENERELCKIIIRYVLV